MTETKILDALNVLRDGGIVEGRLTDHKGRHCGLGAVNRVYGTSAWGIDVPVQSRHERDADVATLAAVAREQWPHLNNWHGWVDRDGDNDNDRVAATFNNLAHNHDMPAIETWFEKAALRRAEEV